MSKTEAYFEFIIPSRYFKSTVSESFSISKREYFENFLMLEVMLLFIRSSLGIKQGLTLSNSCGVIDADYYNNPDNDGHFILNIINTGNSVQRIPARSRVAQAVFVKYLTVDDDNATGERIGGIGSTDG